MQPRWHDVAWTCWRRAGVWAYAGRAQCLVWVALVAPVLVPAFLLADRPERATTLRGRP